MPVLSVYLVVNISRTSLALLNALLLNIFSYTAISRTQRVDAEIPILPAQLRASVAVVVSSMELFEHRL